jgi:hypothetical protein
MVDEAVRVVEQPLPQDDGDDGGDHVGEEHDAAQEVAPAEALVQEQRGRDPDAELEHHGHARVDAAVVEARPELGVAREVAVVPQADEALHRHEGVLVEEAEPDVVENGEDDEPAQQDERRGEEEPADERALPHSPRPRSGLTTSACDRAA